MRNMEEIKIRLPKGNEVLGVVEEKLGGARFRVACTDNKTRICRVPGALKRSLWIDLDNVVLVKPWELQPDSRGDIVARYNEQEIKILKEKGFLK